MFVINISSYSGYIRTRNFTANYESGNNILINNFEIMNGHWWVVYPMKYFCFRRKFEINKKYKIKFVHQR